MSIPTEPIGSIPRPPELIAAIQARALGQLAQPEFDEIALRALRDTILRFEETGSPVITDGEQTKPSFATYPLQGLPNLAPDGVTIPFADGHTRQLPRLTAGPFRYRTNRVLRRFSPGERTRIGVRTCPGGGRDATLTAPRAARPLLTLVGWSPASPTGKPQSSSSRSTSPPPSVPSP